MDLSNTSGEWAKKVKSEVILYPEMIVAFAKIFRWRHESGDNYLISSTRNSRNLTAINRQLFNFVMHLNQVTPLSLKDLATSVLRDFTDSDFQRVVKLLITREFIFPKTSRKEVIANGKYV